MSGDGDKGSHIKEDSNNFENDCEPKSEENVEAKNFVLSEGCSTNQNTDHEDKFPDTLIVPEKQEESTDNVESNAVNSEVKPDETNEESKESEEKSESPAVTDQA